MSTEVQVGDKVRIVKEGVVRSVASKTGTLWLADVSAAFPTETYDSVEVIEKSPPKAGDTVVGVEAYDALPVGTVVKDYSTSSTTWLLVKTSDGFTLLTGSSTTQYSPGEFYSPRTVLYVPPAQ